MSYAVMLGVLRLYGRTFVLYIFNSLGIDLRGSERLKRGFSSAEINMDV